MDLCEQLANDLKDLEKQEIENNEEDQQIKDFISRVSILDSQISQFYQQVKEIYQTKISELHEIVVDPATYCEVVSSLIESNDVSKLKGLIPSDQIITIAVTTSAPKQELDQSQSQNCVQ